MKYRHGWVSENIDILPKKDFSYNNSPPVSKGCKSIKNIFAFFGEVERRNFVIGVKSEL